MKEILITSSVLIAALLALRMVFAQKVSRRLIYGAWVLVALRLLVPVQIGQLDFSVLSLAQPVMNVMDERFEKAVLGNAPEISYQEHVQQYIEKDHTVFTPEVQEQIRQELSQGTQSSAEIYDKIQVKFPQQQILTPAGQEQVTTEIDIENAAMLRSADNIAATVWLVGVAAMAVWFAVVNLRHERMLRLNRERLDCESPIPVFVSEKVSSPCLVGLFCPVVYVTSQCAEKPEMLHHVLTHELTHYRHGDQFWALLRCLCLCVYWFNPLVWVAAWVSRRDCELACDEGALSRLGEAERIAYGKTLLEVVSHNATPAALLQTATAMTETKKQLKQRVNFIARKPRFSMIAALCMVLVCAMVAGCAVAGATTQSQSMEDPTEPTVGMDAPEAEGPHRFAMHDHNYKAYVGWIELDDDGNIMLYRCVTNYMLEMNLQKLGMSLGESVYTSVYRYSGTCVQEGDTYTLTVDKVEETYELECSDPDALLEAVVEMGSNDERADYEKKFRGEYVNHELVDITKVTFRISEGKTSYMELEWEENIRYVYRFHPNGNTQTIEGNEPGSICTRTEYYENGNIRSYRQWRNNDSQGYYLEAYNEHGDIVSSGNYQIDYRTGGNEYEYAYYEDGTKKQVWQYSVGEGASNRHLEYHTEYHPNGTVKSRSTYNYEGNLYEYQEFNTYGKWTYHAQYNSEGEMYYWERAEYRYSDAGVMLELKRYENDVLMCHYEYYENGRKKIRRDYHSNGQLSIYEEYDEQGNTIFAQRYDPDGTLWE